MAPETQAWCSQGGTEHVASGGAHEDMQREAGGVGDCVSRRKGMRPAEICPLDN